MGMHHIAPEPTRNVTVKSVRARLYSAESQTPRTIQAYYRENHPHTGSRFMIASDVISNPRTQSYIHDVTVTIHFRGMNFRFLVFFKRHILLPANQAVQAAGGGLMEGDVLVVACGRNVSIRNLRGLVETRAADQAVIRLSNRLGPIRTRKGFPRVVAV